MVILVVKLKLLLLFLSNMLSFELYIFPSILNAILLFIL
jgi:hypothetical protein